MWISTASLIIPKKIGKHAWKKRPKALKCLRFLIRRPGMPKREPQPHCFSDWGGLSYSFWRLSDSNIIETVNDELKNIAQVEHSRHRCFDNFIVNLLGAIAAYCLFPKKPCINVQRTIDTQLTLFWIRRTHVNINMRLTFACLKSSTMAHFRPPITPSGLVFW